MSYVHSLTEMICLNSFIVQEEVGRQGCLHVEDTLILGLITALVAGDTKDTGEVGAHMITGVEAMVAAAGLIGRAWITTGIWLPRQAAWV
jgi:hypothetical protein